jgi:hypothetical protein
LTYSSISHAVTWFHKKIQVYNKKPRDKPKFQVKASKDEKKSSGRVSDETKCPIYPKAGYTWGEFYAKASNKNKPKTVSNKAPRWAKEDSNATHVDKDDVSITNPSTSLGTLDSISTITATVTLLGTMDSISTVLVTDGMSHSCAWTWIKKANDLNALLAKF